MFERLFFGLLGWLAACALAYAQPPGGPVLVDPDVRRLPLVEPQPLPVEVVPAPAVDEAAVVEEQPAELPAEAVVIETEEEPLSEPWRGSFELGLDGTEGNSETFNFRFGFDVERATQHNVFDFDLDYRKTTNKYEETANRTFFDGRYERLLEDTAWTSFVHGTVDYDEFQAFDLRITLDLGVGYQFIETEFTSFAARIGSGLSHEIGGPDNSYVPEAVFGLDFKHRLNDRHKFTASAEYTPDMTGMNDFRLKSRASWEALIDKEMNLSLKFSVLERHDSTPHSARPNDLDYSVVLLWKF